ncbi:ATP-binding protein [Streptomyces canus]|uniref:ATP-binding protein n=1 Tax=Streptomyces canus TaxID=58343 RepID=UPI0036C21A82
MRAGYALDGDDGCIADARHHAVAFLDQAHADHHLPVPPRARDLTQLVVSELVTNALKYAPGPVLMELRINTHGVDVVVWDSATEDLFIEQEPVGKRITARIALSDIVSCTAARRWTSQPGSRSARMRDRSQGLVPSGEG